MAASRVQPSASWLQHYGFVPTLVEQSQGLRQGGYLIDFWGAEYDVAQRMGLVPELRRCGYAIEQLRVVDQDSTKIAAIDVAQLRSALGDRLITLQRSDLAGKIFAQLDGRTETIFGDSITDVKDTRKGLHVRFERAPARDFDLVVGADGLHSTVRSLVFGPSPQFEKHLGYRVAVSTVRHYPLRDDGCYVCYNTPGKQIARFALRDGRSVFFFAFVSPPARQVSGEVAQRELLEELYQHAGWECADILDSVRHSDDFYFDDVSQIRISRWSEGRVVLIGDACFCPSLLAGQGAALAMGAAYILAGELKVSGGDYSVAFRRYRGRLSRLIAAKQRSAERLGLWFAPATSPGLFVRNQVTRLMSWPFMARWMGRKILDDNFDLPDYSC